MLLAMTHKPKVLIHRWHQLIRTNRFHLKSNGHCRWRDSALRQYCHRIAFTEFDNNLIDRTLFLMMMMTVMRVWIWDPFFSCCCERPEGSEDPGLQAVRGDQLDRWATISVRVLLFLLHVLSNQDRTLRIRRGSSKQNKRPAIGRQSSTRPSTCKSTPCFSSPPLLSTLSCSSASSATRSRCPPTSCTSASRTTASVATINLSASPWCSSKTSWTRCSTIVTTLAQTCSSGLVRLLAFPWSAGQHGRDWVDHPEDSQPEDHGRGGIMITIGIIITIIIIIGIVYPSSSPSIRWHGSLSNWSRKCVTRRSSTKKRSLSVEDKLLLWRTNFVCGGQILSVEDKLCLWRTNCTNCILW